MIMLDLQEEFITLTNQWPNPSTFLSNDECKIVK